MDLLAITFPRTCVFNPTFPSQINVYKQAVKGVCLFFRRPLCCDIKRVFEKQHVLFHYNDGELVGRPVKIIKFLEAEFQLHIYKSPVSLDTLQNCFAKNAVNALKVRLSYIPYNMSLFTAKSLDLIKKNFILDSHY